METHFSQLVFLGKPSCRIIDHRYDRMCSPAKRHRPPPPHPHPPSTDHVWAQTCLFSLTDCFEVSRRPVCCSLSRADAVRSSDSAVGSPERRPSRPSYFHEETFWALCRQSAVMIPPSAVDSATMAVRAPKSALKLPSSFFFFPLHPSSLLLCSSGLMNVLGRRCSAG